MKAWDHSIHEYWEYRRFRSSTHFHSHYSPWIIKYIYTQSVHFLSQFSPWIIKYISAQSVHFHSQYSPWIVKYISAQSVHFHSPYSPWIVNYIYTQSVHFQNKSSYLTKNKAVKFVHFRRKKNPYTLTTLVLFPLK